MNANDNAPPYFEILTYPRDALLLRRKARPVSDDEFGTPAFLDFVQRLGDTCMAAGGMGLAATQVEEAPAGVPWAVFALRVGGSFGIVCNPEILDAAEEKIGAEACLSFASVPEAMLAPSQVTLRGREPEKGEEFTLVLSDEQARCAAHECQHLLGRTMVDRMSQMKKGLFLKRVAFTSTPGPAKRRRACRRKH